MAARLALVLTAVTCAVAAAQETPRQTDALPDTTVRRNAAFLLYDRNRTTDSWIGRAVVDTTLAGATVGLRQFYLANAIQPDRGGPSPGRKLLSDQETLNLRFGLPVAPGLAAAAAWSSLIYSDRKAVGLSNASFHTLLGGVTFDGVPMLSLTPMLGYRWDNQGEARDHGPSIELTARTRDLTLEGYRVEGSAVLHQDRIEPRRLENSGVRIGVQREFGAGSRDTLEVTVGHVRREFYTFADSAIESRLENLFSVANLLEYQVAGGLLVSLFAGAGGRGLDKDFRVSVPGTQALPPFDARINEFRLDVWGQLQYAAGDDLPEAAVRFAFAERTESHEAKLRAGSPPGVLPLYEEARVRERTKDNVSRRSGLSGRLAIPLSARDRLSLSAGAGILRYDTPSPLNFEDRDELLIAATVATTHRLSPTLDLGITLDASSSRLVYLLKERSANNSTNRVLRLTPRTLFRIPGRVATMNAFEVLANYTVYDYEQQVALVRSFSYRQFSWLDSTALELTDRLGLDFLAYLKLYERGQLNWGEFTERRESAVSDRTLAAQLRVRPVPGVELAVGIRSFTQSRSTYAAGLRRLSSVLSSVGPTCVAALTPGPNTRVTLQGWYERQRSPDGPARSLTNMTFNILFTF